MTTPEGAEIRKIYRSGNSPVIAVGDDILRHLGWAVGDAVVLRIREDRLEVAWVPIADV